MTLLTIEEIIEFLNDFFKDTEPELFETLTLPPNKHKIDTEKLKNQLHIKELPDDFITLISQYDFGNFELNNIQFGVESHYPDYLIQMNAPTQYWYEDTRRQNVLLIGNSDPFSILLSLENGSIYAVSAEIPFEEKRKIASSFSQFIQGLGTAFKARLEEKNQDFLKLAKNEFGELAMFFWEEIGGF